MYIQLLLESCYRHLCRKIRHLVDLAGPVPTGPSNAHGVQCMVASPQLVLLGEVAQSPKPRAHQVLQGASEPNHRMCQIIENHWIFAQKPV